MASASCTISTDAHERIMLAVECNFRPKQVIRCTLCGGNKCKNCGEFAYLNQSSPAIPNLNSSWITPTILAMQRPSNNLFQNGLINEFLKNGVACVFNLTEPGEHPYCGSKSANVINNIHTDSIIDSRSGFPYNPEVLMSNGIKHFNYAWPDMTAPSINMMKDIVFIARNELKYSTNSKIAVHCHAGYGRTGMAIACILIADSPSMTSDTAIATVRNNRKGSIQTSTQVKFIHKFEKEVNRIKVIFPQSVATVSSNAIDCNRKTIAKSIQDLCYINLLPYSSSSSHHDFIHLIVTSKHVWINHATYSHVMKGICYTVYEGIAAATVDDSATSFMLLRQKIDATKEQLNSNDYTILHQLVSSSSTFVAKDTSICCEAYVIGNLYIEWIRSRTDSVLGEDMVTHLGIVLLTDLTVLQTQLSDLILDTLRSHILSKHKYVLFVGLLEVLVHLSAFASKSDMLPVVLQVAITLLYTSNDIGSGLYDSNGKIEQQLLNHAAAIDASRPFIGNTGSGDTQVQKVLIVYQSLSALVAAAPKPSLDLTTAIEKNNAVRWTPLEGT